MTEPKDAAKGLGDLVTQGLGILQQGVNTLAGALRTGDSSISQLDAALTGRRPAPGPVQVPASVEEVAERVVSLVRQGQGEAQRSGDPTAPGVVAPFREATRLLAQTSLPVDTSSLTGLVPSPGGLIRGGLRALRGSMTLSRLASGTGSLEDMEEIVSLAEDLVGQAQKGIQAVQGVAPALAPAPAPASAPAPAPAPSAPPARRRASRARKTAEPPNPSVVAFSRAMAEEMGDSTVERWAGDVAAGKMTEEKFFDRWGKRVGDEKLGNPEELLARAKQRAINNGLSPDDPYLA